MKTIPEAVSQSERLRRSRRMHAIINKLLRLKKLKAARFASPETLKKRAQILARTLMRKRLAGVSGSEYHKLSPSQRVHIDKLVDALPKARMKMLANKLVPVVTKAEKARLMAFKKSQKAVSEEVNLKKRRKKKHSHPLHKTVKDQAYELRIHKEETEEPLEERHKRVTNRERLKRKHKMEIHRMRRDRGRHIRKHRHSKKGLDRAAVRQARQQVAQRAGIRDMGTGYDAEAKSAFINRQAASRVAAQIKKRGIPKRADLQRLSTRGNTYDLHMRHGGHGTLRADYEPSFEEVLLEDDKKFEQLFLRGLVNKQEIEIYKRIFRNLTGSIKLHRYRGNIVKVLDRLIDLITNNESIYHRVRQELQKGH